MSKGLRNIREPERARIVRNRLLRHSGGLGYLAAVDAAKKMGVAVPAPVVVPVAPDLDE